jgi:hypothetical protein
MFLQTLLVTLLALPLAAFAQVGGQTTPTPPAPAPAPAPAAAPAPAPAPAAVQAEPAKQPRESKWRASASVGVSF